MADYIILNKTDLKKELKYSRNVEPDNMFYVSQKILLYKHWENVISKEHIN